jgi:putative transposase
MSHAYVSNRLHIVFSTAERRRSLPAEIQPRLWAYMAGIARKLNIVVRKVGGFDDHAHVFIDLPTTVTTSAAVQKIKANSSRWLRQEGVAAFEWQRGYAALSVSASATEAVKKYVRDQPEHHKKHTFEDEFKSLLARYGLKFDPDDLL